tara:strand:+ start:102 stop:665 length:564 start_codon:yes stop_codon:yes gene_type:complete
MIQNAIQSIDHTNEENREIIREMNDCLRELDNVLHLQKEQETIINEVTSKLIQTFQIIVYEIKATIAKTEHMDYCEANDENTEILTLYNIIKDANVSRQEKEKILLCATIEEMDTEHDISRKYSFWAKLDHVYDTLNQIQYLDDPSMRYIYMMFKDWDLFKEEYINNDNEADIKKLFKLFFIHNSFF